MFESDCVLDLFDLFRCFLPIVCVDLAGLVSLRLVRQVEVLLAPILELGLRVPAHEAVLSRPGFVVVERTGCGISCLLLCILPE